MLKATDNYQVMVKGYVKISTIQPRILPNPAIVTASAQWIITLALILPDLPTNGSYSLEQYQP